MKYAIHVSCCDDDTHVHMELTDVEVAAFRRLAAEVNDGRRNGCQPEIVVCLAGCACNYCETYGVRL